MMLVDDLEALAQKHGLYKHYVDPEDLKELDEFLLEYDSLVERCEQLIKQFDEPEK